MKTVTISGSARTETGKKATKALRGQGLVPCVLYGGQEQVHFFADTREFKKVIFTPDAFNIDLAIGDKNYKAVIQHTQYHPISDELIHADFYELDENRLVTIGIPIKITGNSVGVRAGGKLMTKTRKLKIKALPANLPDFISIDISNLNIGDSVKVNTLSAEGVTFLDAPNVVVVSVATTRAAAAAATAAAATGKK